MRTVTQGRCFVSIDIFRYRSDVCVLDFLGKVVPRSLPEWKHGMSVLSWKTGLENDIMTAHYG